MSRAETSPRCGQRSRHRGTCEAVIHVQRRVRGGATGMEGLSASALARRKKIYQQLHPETKPEGDRKANAQIGHLKRPRYITSGGRNRILRFLFSCSAAFTFLGLVVSLLRLRPSPGTAPGQGSRGRRRFCPLHLDERIRPGRTWKSSSRFVASAPAMCDFL